MRIAALVLVAPITLLSTYAWANLIVNGGFETPAGSGSFRTFDAPNDAITGWKVESGSVDLARPSLYAPFDGNQSLDLNGDAPGTIIQSLDLNGNGPGALRQEIVTEVDASYELTF